MYLVTLKKFIREMQPSIILLSFNRWKRTLTYINSATLGTYYTLGGQPFLIKRSRLRLVKESQTHMEVFLDFCLYHRHQRGLSQVNQSSNDSLLKKENQKFTFTTEKMFNFQHFGNFEKLIDSEGLQHPNHLTYTPTVTYLLGVVKKTYTPFMRQS